MNAFLASSLAYLAAACSSSSIEPPLVKSDLERNLDPQVSDTAFAELIAGNTAFAGDLYQQVRDESGNLFMSPHSITTALAMTFAGANGATASQIADALHFTLPPETLHAALSKLDLALASRAEGTTSNAIPFRLRTANSLWGQEGWTFMAPFLDALAVNYGAGLHVLDFEADAEASRETINAWVEQETNDKILDLLPRGSITNLTRLVLTNAIYFSAAWDTPFEADNTADRPFHLAGGETISVPTLAQNEEMGYGEGDGWAAVEIPYDGGKLSMVVVVPSDFAAFESAIDGPLLAAIPAAITHHLVDLKLPKFRFDAPLGLGDVLKALGMVDAFDEAAADFSGIDGTRQLHVSDVLHKGFVGIDEKGTEAAAATAVVINTDSIPQPAQLVVDRPFVFFIRDRPTGAILFVGRVVDPR